MYRCMVSMCRYIVSGIWENGSLYVQMHGSPAAHNHRDISNCKCVFETSLYGWLVGMEKVRHTGIMFDTKDRSG